MLAAETLKDSHLDWLTVIGSIAVVMVGVAVLVVAVYCIRRWR
jgi:hypothetical protein